MALTPRRRFYPNVHSLTSNNPTMKFFDAARAEVAPECADLYEVLTCQKPGWVPGQEGNKIPGNTAIQPVGRNPVLDACMARAAELLAAAE